MYIALLFTIAFLSVVCICLIFGIVNLFKGNMERAVDYLGIMVAAANLTFMFQMAYLGVLEIMRAVNER